MKKNTTIDKKSMKINLEHFQFIEKPKTFVKKYQDMYDVAKEKAANARTEFEQHFIKYVDDELKKGPPMKVEIKHLKTGVAKSWDNVTGQDKTKLAAEVIELIKLKRKEVRKLHPVIRKFDGAEFETYGGTFTLEQAKSILEIGKRISKNDPLKPKTPKVANTNYIGVELEFAKLPGHSIKTIGKAFQDAGLSKYVQVDEDASCGFEVKVLLTETDYKEPLAKITKLIKDMGFNVDARCGTHVHLDMRFRDHKMCYANLFKTQRLMQKLVREDRVLDNKYCVENEFATFDEHMNHKFIGTNGENARTVSRRHTINPLAYNDHKTLEVRCLEGTLDAKIISNWIGFLLKVVNYNKALPRAVSSLVAADTMFKFEPELKKDLRARIPKSS